MNDQVGCLHFFANFDSGNLESASLIDPLLASSSAPDVTSPLSAVGSFAPTDAIRRRGPKVSTTLKDQQYFLRVSPDCAGQGSFESAHNRSWFYFGVTFVGEGDSSVETPSAPNSESGSSRGGTPISTRQSVGAGRSCLRHKATFSVVNLLATNLIFEHDNRPVYCNDTMQDWERLPQPLIIQYHDKSGASVSQPPPSFLQQFHAELSRSGGGGSDNASSKKFSRGWHTCSQRISWNYTFTCVGETVHFAMCFPFSYHRQLQLIDEWRTQYGDDRGMSYLYDGPKQYSIPAAVGSFNDSFTSAASTESSLPPVEKLRHRTPPPLIGSASAPTTPAKAIFYDGSPRAPSNVSQRSKKASQLSIIPPLPPPVTSASALVSSSSTPTTTANSIHLTDPSEGVYFHRETLCFSIENRRVDLLTISGHNGKHPEGLREPPINHVHPVRSETPRPWVFPEKRIVLITCRVHPGETPASHVLHGMIEFLLSNKDPRSVALRQHFVFKIVPILNPDGVACGHYRTDTRGVNLNRMYDNPDPRFHPTIYAARELFLNLEATKRLVLYVDLHAHASKRGCFVFGNAWEDDATQTQALLYPKLLSMNSAHFDFPSCDFTSRSMRSGNKTDGTTKGGTGRVALAASGGLVECYTLEASYCMGLTLNPIVTLDVDKVHAVDARNKEQSRGHAKHDSSSGQPQRRVSRSHSLDSRRISGSSPAGASLRYSPETYHELGRGIATALLDLTDCNPVSRIQCTSHHSVDGVRSWLERQVRMLHAEQMRIDGEGEKRKTTLEHNRSLERLGAALHLPIMNAYNNSSQHKLTRNESGAVITLKAVKEQQDGALATAPLRLLA